MAKTAITSTDFIPTRDDDFFNFQKNLRERLREDDGIVVPPMPGATPNFEKWGIPSGAVTRLDETGAAYEPLYHKSQNKKNRTSGDVTAHRQARDGTDLLPGYEKLIREFVGEHIRKNKKIPDSERALMGLTVPDTEPSPLHGSHLTTLAPIVGMKNMGGAKIDLRFRRTSDQTRPSMPRGYTAEISFQTGGAAPSDPDAVGMKSKISSKARFQLSAGMSNLGKTLFVFARFKHKTNEAFDSPWTNLMQITIA